MVKSSTVFSSETKIENGMIRNKNEEVTMKKYVAIYATVYSLIQIIFMVCTGEYLGQYIGGLGYVPLIISAIPVCYAFTHKYGRTFSSTEFRKILIASIIVDIVWKIGSISSMFSVINPKPLIAASFALFLIGIVMHTVILGLFYSSMIVSLYIRKKSHMKKNDNREQRDAYWS